MHLGSVDSKVASSLPSRLLARFPMRRRWGALTSPAYGLSGVRFHTSPLRRYIRLHNFSYDLGVCKMSRDRASNS